MIIDKIKGDIVDLLKQGKMIAHGCNCFHAMNSGVAAALASEFPGVRAEDNKTPYGKDKRGQWSFYYDEESFGLCINLYTQFNPGKDASYGAIATAFERLNTWYKEADIKGPIFIPKIGSGIGGLEWYKVKTIIDVVTPDIPIILVEWSDGEVTSTVYPRPPKLGLDVLLVEQ